MRIAKSLIGSLALGLTLALGAAACGGGVGSATPTPSSTASLTSSTGQTPSPFTKVAATATLTAPMPSPETPSQSGELLDPGSAPPPQVPTPADIIDGGIIQDGPFIFYLWLFRDPQFNPHPDIPSLYSDLDGIAAYLSWIYQGADPEGPVYFSWGTLPELHQFGMDTMLSPGEGGGGGLGIHLPGGTFSPGKSMLGDRIKVGIKLGTPHGEYGAMVVFTLQTGTAGFEPGDITVELLPSAVGLTPTAGPSSATAQINP